LVIQLWPKSNVRICLTKIQSCTHHGWSRPSCWRIDSICCLSEICPARISAGSPPKNLNRKKISRTTPASVGIICHRRRTR
jgi:hypothetical protein